MALTLRRTLIASARQVIRWCTPETPWAMAPPFWPINPTSFAGRWHEPAYVASFVLFGVPRLAAEWSRPLNAEGYGLCITGVFCHQSPKVEMNRAEWVSGGECELGDLLIVHDHKGRDATATIRRAVLVQAKMPFATGSFADNPRQSFLYERWPYFWIRKPDVFDKNRRWDLGDNSQGARYAQIMPGASRRRFLRARSPWAFQSCSGETILRQSDDMAAFLVAMLDFDGLASRGRKATVGGSDDWSALIDVMLDKMKVRAFTNKQLLGQRRGPRVVSAIAGNHFLRFVAAGSSQFGGDGGGEAEPRIPEDANPGVSMVLIETSAHPD